MLPGMRMDLSSGGPPVASYTFTPGTISEGESIQFTDTSSPAAISWTWRANGGNGVNPTSSIIISNIQNPLIDWQTLYDINGDGDYTIKLTVNGGSFVQHSVTVELVVPDITSVTSDLTTLSEGLEAAFTYAIANAPSSWNLQAFTGSGWVTVSTSDDPRVTWATFFAVSGVMSYGTRLTATNTAGPSPPFPGPTITIVAAPASPYTVNEGDTPPPFFTGSKGPITAKVYGRGGAGGTTDGGGAGGYSVDTQTAVDAFIVIAFSSTDAAVTGGGFDLNVRHADGAGGGDASGGSSNIPGGNGGSFVGGGAGCGSGVDGDDGVFGVSAGAGSAGANGGGDGGNGSLLGNGGNGTGLGSGGGAAAVGTPGTAGRAAIVLTW